MCTVLLPPVVNPTAVNKCTKHEKHAQGQDYNEIESRHEFVCLLVISLVR